MKTSYIGLSCVKIIFVFYIYFVHNNNNPVIKCVSGVFHKHALYGGR